MAILGIKPGARVLVVFRDVSVPGTLRAVSNGGRIGAVRVDSTGRTYWLPAEEIATRWPWSSFD
ncbi:hypothetical protein ACGF5F_29495 [Streptomyces sp. NPDC047821]|uniref:hypothetical protein n=1 Tax=Streptomyces sp. NPDC047821 TaxID=3365488 RepID=UPI003716A1E9